MSSLGALGACCGCELGIKQAAIATTWNAWGGFAIFDGSGNRLNPEADTPRYSSLRTTENLQGGKATQIGGPNGVTEHIRWQWYGLLGNAGWSSDLDPAIKSEVWNDWGVGQTIGCGCETSDPLTETHLGIHYDGGLSNRCTPDSSCDAQWQRYFATDLSDKVDWRNPTIPFDAERAVLDAIDWSAIPPGMTAACDIVGFYSNGIFPPEIPNGDIVGFLGRGGPLGVVPFSLQDGLFTLDDEVASARVLCGPDPIYDGCMVYGLGDEPPGLEPRLNPPAVPVCVPSGHEAPSLYRGFVVRTRIESPGTFCAVEFDQIGTLCEGGIGTRYLIGRCDKNANGPILYEPRQLGLIVASLSKKYSCCL